MQRNSNLILVDASPVAGSCYQRLQFELLNNERSGTLTLFLTPDHRYLLREMMDTALDPEAEQMNAAKETEGKLLTGSFAQDGLTNAPNTIVIFSDFQCPYCKNAAKLLREQFMPAEGETVRLVFRNFPLGMHKWSEAAAEAASCARNQSDSAFWELHDLIFQHQSEITLANLEQQLNTMAESVHGLNLGAFRKCIQGHEMKQVVDDDVQMGTRSLVTATPTVFINGHKLPEGVRSVLQIKARLRQYERVGDIPRRTVGATLAK
jgi:protein-disulfide isomerase